MVPLVSVTEDHSEFGSTSGVSSLRASRAPVALASSTSGPRLLGRPGVPWLEALRPA
jgi:hypothetical protein